MTRRLPFIRPALVPATLLSAAIASALFAAPSRAGVIGKGDWTPSACGARPQAPALDLKNADAYNRSVDGINTYRQAIKQYIDCLVTEANADIQAVSKSATEAQRRAREANEKILADVKRAEEKFK